MSYQRLIGPHKKVGRPARSRRRLVAERFGLKMHSGTKRLLSTVFMDQLDRCKGIAAKRILLGVSK